MRGAWPLVLFSWGFQRWTLAIPLYGPVLFFIAGAAGINPAPKASIFLLTYALSYAGWGWLFTKRMPSPATLAQAVDWRSLSSNHRQSAAFVASG